MILFSLYQIHVFPQHFVHKRYLPKEITINCTMSFDEEELSKCLSEVLISEDEDELEEDEDEYLFDDDSEDDDSEDFSGSGSGSDDEGLDWDEMEKRAYEEDKRAAIRRSSLLRKRRYSVPRATPA